MGVFDLLKKKVAPPVLPPLPATPKLIRVEEKEAARPPTAPMPARAAPTVVPAKPKAEALVPRLAVPAEPGVGPTPAAAPARAITPLPFPAKEGPFFVSLARFNEIHMEIENIKRDAADLNATLSQLQQGAANDSQVLNTTAQRLEDLKSRLETVAQTLKI